MVLASFLFWLWKLKPNGFYLRAKIDRLVSMGPEFCSPAPGTASPKTLITVAWMDAVWLVQNYTSLEVSFLCLTSMCYTRWRLNPQGWETCEACNSSLTALSATQGLEQADRWESAGLWTDLLLRRRWQVLSISGTSQQVPSALFPTLSLAGSGRGEGGWNMSFLLQRW